MSVYSGSVVVRRSATLIYNTGKGIRLIFLNLEAREFLKTLIGNERDGQVARPLPWERLLFFINGFLLPRKAMLFIW